MSYSDGDGIADLDETAIFGTDPYFADTDEDGLSDGWEVLWGMNPLSADDPQADPDGDGLANNREMTHSTDPHDSDTDDDGLSDRQEVDQGSDPLDGTDGLAKYFAHPLPYQTGFAEFNVGDLDGQRGWQVCTGTAQSSGSALYRRYLVLEPGSVVRKAFIDSGTDHRYVRLRIVAEANSQIKVLSNDGPDEVAVAAVKFDTDGTIYIADANEYQPTQTDWQTLQWCDLTMQIDFQNDTYDLLWEAQTGAEPTIIYQDAALLPCDAISAVEFHTDDAMLFVNTMSISDYGDPNSTTVRIDHPCHCDGVIAKSRTPVIGRIWNPDLAYYVLGYCPAEQNPYDQDAHWFGFHRGTGVVEPGGPLGYWDTGSIPNGYYYLAVQVVDERGYTQVYLLEDDATDQAAPVIVSSDLKCNTFHHAAEPDITVAWPGQFPFELRRIYNNNRRLEDSPLCYGWRHNFDITLTEDTRYYYDYFEGFYGTAYADHSFLGYGDIWITMPDGSKRIFRHHTSGDCPSEDDGTPQQPSVYRPYPPENDTGDYIQRVTEYSDAVGFNHIDSINYRLIQRDGAIWEFSIANPDIPEYPPYACYNGQVGWRIETGIEKMSDRFGNSLDIEYFSGSENLTIESIRYGAGDNAPRIEFDRNVSGLFPGTYAEARLKIDNQTQRTVRYDRQFRPVAYPEYLRAYLDLVVTRIGAGIDQTGQPQSDPNTVKYTTYNTYSWRNYTGLQWIRYTHSVGELPNIAIKHDMWGRVGNRWDMVNDDDYSATSYYYQFYHPDPNDRFNPDPDPDPDAESYLKTYAITPYRADITTQDNNGAAIKQETLTFDCAATPLTTAEYNDADFPGLPTYSEESFDGFVRKTTSLYDNFGSPVSQTITNNADQQLISNTTEYHQNYPFPTHQTTTPGPASPGPKTEAKYIYGKADGSVDPCNPANNKYLIAQETLLSTDPCDPNNNVWAVTTYKYNTQGLVTETVDPNGFRTLIEYDDRLFKKRVKIGLDSQPATMATTERYLNDCLGQVLLKANHLGGVTLCTYDDFGHLHTVSTFTDPAALTLPDTAGDLNDAFTVTRYQNHATNNTVTFIGKTTYGYDERGRRMYEQKPDGSVTRTWYTRSGLPKKIRSGGAITQYFYDDRGQKTLELMSDPNGLNDDWMINHQYDSLARRIATFWYDYDDSTLLKGRLHPYNAAGKKRYEKLIGPDPLDGQLCLQLQTDYTYDITGHLTGKTVAAGTDSEYHIGYTWDGAGNRTSLTDPNGNITYYDYDNANRQIAEYFAAPPGSDPADATVKKTTEYYPNNNVAAVTSYDYDPNTVLAHSTFTYDPRGRVVRIAQAIDDANTAVTTYEYSDTGFVVDANTYHVRITDAESKQTHWAYDPFSRVTRILYPSGDYQEMTYNSVGALAARAVFEPNDAKRWIDYTYDTHGRLARITYPDDGYLEFTRDGFGRKTIITDHRTTGDNIGGTAPWTATITYNHDPLGRLTCQTDQDGYQTHQEYWADGQTYGVVVTAPNDPCDELYAVYYFHDPAGRLYFIREQQPTTGNNIVAIYTHDDRGNIAQANYPLACSQAGPQLYLDYSYNRENLINGYAANAYVGGQWSDPNFFRLTDVTLDGLGRLTDANEYLCDTAGDPLNHSLHYEYDKMGSTGRRKRDQY